VEDKISQIKDKIDICEKNRRILRLQSCGRNTQELCNSIKSSHLFFNAQNMGIEEKEKVQAKGIHNIFNKIITKNLPTIEKELLIQVQEASRTPNRHDQNRTPSWHIIVKTSSTVYKERKLKEKKF
jgi:hypothetical protein